MDPFSIIAGSAGLLDVSIKLISYLKEIERAAGKVDEEIISLSREIEALVATNKSIEQFWRLASNQAQDVELEDKSYVDSVWKELSGLLQDCGDEARKLEQCLEEIVGKNGPRVTGKWDGIKKHLRRQAKELEFQQVRSRLTRQRDEIRILLQTLNGLRDNP